MAFSSDDSVADPTFCPTESPRDANEIDTDFELDNEFPEDDYNATNPQSEFLPIIEGVEPGQSETLSTIEDLSAPDISVPDDVSHNTASNALL